MAGKKYYAVKKGKITGIFKSWEECRDSVNGYSGAEYKGFVSLEEAEAYMGRTQVSALEKGESTFGAEIQKNQSVEKSGEDKGRNAERSDGQKTKIAQNGNTGSSQNRNVKSSRRKNTSNKQNENKQDRNTESDRGRGITGSKEEAPAPGTLLAYVDGSYDHSLKKYAFGCVFITSDGAVETEYGNGDNAQSLQHRNVTGEMLGAMYAVKVAMISGFSRVEICYDYQGIEKWVTGEWCSRTDLTRKYALAMREWGKDIEICFTKVAAHTNVYYNELADKMAKTGLREGTGIPKVRRIGNPHMEQGGALGTD